MKHFLKIIFCVSTNETKKTKQVICSVSTIIFLIFVIVLSDIFLNRIAYRVIASICCLSIVIVSLILLIKLSVIGDNRDKFNFKSATKKIKYASIQVKYEDVKFFLEHALMPETLYVKSSNGNNYIIDVSFEITGRNGKFYNKQLFLDDDNVSLAEMLHNIKKNMMNDSDEIELLALSEFSCPNDFYKIIELLKINEENSI